MSVGEIIVRGQSYRCLAPVRPWTSTGMHFLTRMRHETRWIINHWTAAENSADRAFEFMRDHKSATTGKPEALSVHFIVDQLGEIYQCADADARCAHCADGGGNSYGVGIEIINRGHGKAPDKGFTRTRRTERIHGRLIEYGEFFPAQIASVIALNAALCSAYSLPMRVPILNGDVFPTVLPAHIAATFRGPAGHLHFSPVKPDPGLDLLRKIHAHGMAVGIV